METNGRMKFIVLIQLLIFFRQYQDAIADSMVKCKQPTAPDFGGVQLHGDSKVGSTVIYFCNKDKKILGEAMSKCLVTGQWSINPPKCLYYCTVPDIENGEMGISTEYISRYRRKEIFEKIAAGEEVYQDEKLTLQCDEDYFPADGETVLENNKVEVTCNNGTWSRILQCLTTRCNTDEIGYPGLVKPSKKIFRSLESFDIKCEEGFTPTTSTKRINCNKGIWGITQNPCQDTKCNTDKMEYPGLVKPSKKIFRALESFDIKCEQGFTTTTSTKSITCNGGMWDITQNPCREEECRVPSIDHGAMGYYVFGDWFWNWRKFQYEQTKRFYTYPVDTLIKVRESLLVFCTPPYFIQGIHGHYEARVRCHKGNFTMDPVCLKYEDIPPTSASRPVLNTTIRNFPEISTSAINSFTPVLSTTVSDDITTPTGIYDENNRGISMTAIPSTEPPEEECFCKYPLNDGDIVGQVDGMRLIFDGKVKNGKTVVFRCLHVGFSRFSGRREINCSECEEWHSSNFPSCSDPIKGDTVILLNDRPEILMDGTVQLHKGKSARFTCAAMETAEYPEWRTPDVPNMSFNEVSHEREKYGDVIYTTNLHINDINYDNEGNYECSIKGHPKTSINVIVIDPGIQCPKIKEEYGLIIKYDTERRERSKVHFSCPQNREIIGKPELTCLKSGNWSDSPPRCSEIRCKALKGTDLLKIYYSGNRVVDSRATFHCISPGKRSGVSYTRCLPNGTWAHPLPTCSEINEASSFPPIQLEIRSSIPSDVHSTTRPSVGGHELTNTSTSDLEDVNNCYCTYEREGFITVRTRNRTLKVGDKVKKGDTVSFECIDYRFLSWQNGLRVYGAANVTCTACDRWRNPRNPACSALQHGPPFIVLIYPLKLLSKGTAIVDEGTPFRLLCGSTFYYPKWIAPDSREMIQNKFIGGGNSGVSVFYSFVDLFASSDQINGMYECNIPNQMKTTLQIEVKQIRCEALEDTDLLKIYYSGNREIDSRATFHCFSPGKRSGVSYTRCLPNGTWEHPVPTCSVPTCSINDLLTSVSSNVEPMPNKENNDVYDFNSAVKLTCKNGVAEGNPVAICDKEGQWNISSIECKRVCKPPTNFLDENIRLNPDKTIYMFGESVVLSCPYGMKLSKGPQKIICIFTGWSPNNFPNCIED